MDIDADTTVEQAMSRQDERINRLSNAVANLEEALTPILNPELDGEKEMRGELASPALAPVLLKLNDNNERIHYLYSRIFALTDRLALKPAPQKEEAALDSSR